LARSHTAFGLTSSYSPPILPELCQLGALLGCENAACIKPTINRGTHEGPLFLRHLLNLLINGSAVGIFGINQAGQLQAMDLKSGTMLNSLLLRVESDVLQLLALFSRNTQFLLDLWI
jgi:hypothetical protein